MILRFGKVRVAVVRDSTVTTFDDGSMTVASHREQKGQVETAKSLGMTVQEMNETHDLTHTLLANWLGMEYSPTLRGVALGVPFSMFQIEEDAVLAIQRWAKLCGVDLRRVAQRMAV